MACEVAVVAITIRVFHDSILYIKTSLLGIRSEMCYFCVPLCVLLCAEDKHMGIGDKSMRLSGSEGDITGI